MILLHINTGHTNLLKPPAILHTNYAALPQWLIEDILTSLIEEHYQGDAGNAIGTTKGITTTNAEPLISPSKSNNWSAMPQWHILTSEPSSSYTTIQILAPAK